MAFRSQDSVVLGGTHTHDWNLTPTKEDRDFIWKGSKKLSPESVAGAGYIKDWVGLRPGRPSVRLERETRRRGSKNVEVEMLSRVKLLYAILRN